jgi:hypothetical protein
MRGRSHERAGMCRSTVMVFIAQRLDQSGMNRATVVVDRCPLNERESHLACCAVTEQRECRRAIHHQCCRWRNLRRHGAAG